jgi:hypothetical protein
MEKEAFLTIEELNHAWKNWLCFHRGLYCEETETRFFDYCHSHEQSFIDDPLDWDSDVEKFHVARDTAHRVKLAASTNWHAVFKAYYVKHPWK